LIPSAQDANSSESEMSQTGERWGTVRAVWAPWIEAKAIDSQELGEFPKAKSWWPKEKTIDAERSFSSGSLYNKILEDKHLILFILFFYCHIIVVLGFIESSYKISWLASPPPSFSFFLLPPFLE
jgi:uncharacterized metal-binding protein